MTRAKVAQDSAGHAVELEAPFSEGLEVTPEFEEAWRKSRERRYIGRALERLRRESNLTQVELAKRMGKDQAFVSRMESGRGPMPKAEHVALYAERCGYMTAYAFISQEDENEGLLLHELQPIAQGAAKAARLERVRNVALQGAAAARVVDKA